MKLSVVIPVYNSEMSLPELIQRLNTVLPKIAEQYEILMVNDGSKDGSWECIRRYSQEYPWIRGINLMRNYGQHNALLCGIRAAKYPITVTMDDDLQHPPEAIAQLLEKIREGFLVVYGRPVKEQHNLWRDLASQATKIALQNAMGAETAQNVSAFRAFHTQIREAFSQYQGSYPSIDVLLTWGANRFTSVPVQFQSRRYGNSQYTFAKLVRHAINMITGFSIVPLQLASLIGFSFTLFGLGVLAYVIGRYILQGGSVPGFPFLASIIAIFSGAQLFALGIIGEYLARMHFRLMERPTYTIQEVTDTKEHISDES